MEKMNFAPQSRLEEKSQEELMKMVNDDERTLINNWNQINGEHKKGVLEALIAKKYSFFDEDIKILSEGSIGVFLNRLADAGYSADFFKDAIDLAEDGSLGYRIYSLFENAGYMETIRYAEQKNKFRQSISLKNAA